MEEKVMLSPLILTFTVTVTVTVCAQTLAKESQELSAKGCPSQFINGENRAIKGCVKDATPHLPSAEKNDRVMVFVSFSMPDASLKALAESAKKHHAILVMRGLYQDSFAQTAQKIQELGISVDIHPELFETHHVTSVPTFVRIKDGQATHILKGNVTLEFVRKAFEGTGTR
jgi:type-F conjugative transfer system pilin assembly protein TrbC